MKKIAVIGGGIIGMTLVNYLDSKQFEVLLYDSGKNQATGASAGIISPWLSKRRNKQWYALARDGAAFYEQLVSDFSLTNEIYEKCGTLFVRDQVALDQLEQLAIERKEKAPEIGQIRLLNPKETSEILPILRPTPSLYISGGARLDGKAYLNHLRKRALGRGVRIISDEVKVQKAGNGWEINRAEEKVVVDKVVLAPGPKLKDLLEPLGYSTAVEPQKGQLISFSTDLNTNNWPVAFLDGEADLIPFNKGEILLGATHENEAKWDLRPTKKAFEKLTQGVDRYLNNNSLTDFPYSFRVGTRAYTPDFAPFFGPLKDEVGLIVASGLGSSGLTTGPYIAFLLSEFLNGKVDEWEMSNYEKDFDHYITVI
ncbi:NAD(P)/FAD-dependent oxidoreductase [Lactococcus fujiensis]|uniref:Oxidoreductase n=1 Tax=Lactococcus fujiensis JCM 16395 TaxID=1291764 RepID=A0A2A5RJF5_9LACT|nr:FAD-dependent oxidoreductase [Lactococcus fujiensis]PCR99244.1 oxidoreductase [Lactococcus fujiensis JCM 16395]